MKHWESRIIIIAAILTSMPRWIIALLAGEGILVPDAWASIWTVISAVLAGGMAGSMMGAQHFNPRTMQKILGTVLVVAIVFLGRKISITCSNR